MNYVLLVSVFAALASGCASEPLSATTEGATRVPESTTGSCPARDFSGFLRAFASDERVRLVYTAPWVDVTEWNDVDETQQGTSMQRVRREAYKDFKLRHRGGRYVHLEQEDSSDAIPVEPRVTAEPGGYRVGYVFNMSEGNSWTFARNEACWQLVADPEPSLL